MANEMERVSLLLYTKASEYAQTKGIIIADTKFEFGIDKDNQLVLADELFTPDSSRFWPGDEYQVGKSQTSFDKQFIRNHLLSIHFDNQTGIELPNEVINKTIEKYKTVFKILTGKQVIL
jgi:phosphoribosylaminoimidazole-succinocarboxamide synthase